MTEHSFKSGFSELHLTDDGRLCISVNDPRGASGGIVAVITDRKALELLREMFVRAQSTYLTPTEDRIVNAIVQRMENLPYCKRCQDQPGGCWACR